MQKYYYPKTIKNVVIAFMDMFNDISIKKYDVSGNALSTDIVPLQFGPVEKYHQDRTEDHYYDRENNEHGDRFYMMIPRMAVLLNGISYNPDRAYGVNEWRYWLQTSLETSGSDILETFADYQPTPYDLNFTLYVRSDSLDKFAQIMENILPYFNPALDLRVKEFSFLNIERDLHVTLDSVVPEFAEDMANPDDRYVNGQLNFTVHAYMYRPWTYSQIIKVINTRYYVGDTDVFTDSYSTSGYQTSAGELVTSAGPSSDEYSTSGNYGGEWVTSASYDTSGNYDEDRYYVGDDGVDVKFDWFRSTSASNTS